MIEFIILYYAGRNAIVVAQDASKHEMKRSRTKKALLALLVVVVFFVGISLLLSRNSNDDRTWGSWLDLVESNKIGVVSLEGELISSDEILRDIRKFQKKSSVRAIVIRINCPGGAVAPAQELYEEIKRTRRKKPVVASMQTIGTSAAYYVASSSDKIVCSAGTITGSIGVIMMLADLEKIVERVGVNVRVIKAGKYKDIGSMLRPMTEEEHTILQDFATQIHEQFIQDVAQARKGKIQEHELRAISDGRFFTGEKAKEIGLVDAMGNFYDAVKIASDLAGVKGEPELIYPKKRWESYLELLAESTLNVVARVFGASKRVHSAVDLR